MLRPHTFSKDVKGGLVYGAKDAEPVALYDRYNCYIYSTVSDTSCHHRARSKNIYVSVPGSHTMLKCRNSFMAPDVYFVAAV